MNRRGFTLLEIIGTLIVISVLAVIGTRLMATSMRSIYDSVTAREAIIHHETAIASLRADVLHATNISSAANNQLNFDGQITWQSDSTGTRRTDGNESRQWSGVQLQFQINEIGVAIRPASSRESQAIELVSVNRWIQ